MQAIVFERTGSAEEVLVVRDIPIPAAARGEVLVRVAARTVQPADFLFISGRYRLKPVFPQVAGFEGVGTVARLGPGVDEPAPGERVAFRSVGAWAEFVSVPERRLYRVPPGIPDDIAAQFALNPLTAYGLLASCDLAPGARLLLTAGRSVVAGLVAALAQRQGVTPLLLVREGSGHAVSEAVDGARVAEGASIEEALSGALEEGPFQAILDALGGAATPALINALESGGRLVTYGVLDDGPFSISAAPLLFKNLTWQGFGLDAWLNAASEETLLAAQQTLWAMISEDAALLPVRGTFDLGRVKEAIEAARAPHRSGKVLLVS